MERIFETRLYAAITESLSGKQSLKSVDGDLLWREFADTIALSDSANHSVQSHLRGLFQLRAELRHLLYLSIEKKELRCVFLIEKALGTLESEIELINLRLRYPDSVRPTKMLMSNLCIADGFSQTDLMEIIKGLHAIRFSRRRDGAFATLAELTLVLGSAFNVEYPRLDQKVHYTVNRTKGPAQFLTRLVDCLEELSRR